MAVQRRVNWLSQARVDVPNMKMVESAVSNDFDQLIQAFVTNTSQGYILRGFEISMVGAIGGAASNLQMLVDPGAVFHIAASQSGTVLMVPPGTSSQQLNGATNSNVNGSFVPNSLNYIGLDYTRYIDPTTDVQVYLWDPSTDEENTITAPSAQILKFSLSISTTPWSSNLLPIAIVQTDAGNNVLDISDSRWLLYRLATGGSNPNAFYKYPWTAQPEGRQENPSTSSSNSINPFEGGDKMLFSMKDWMNAVMTLFWEINGGTYWYSSGTGGSLAKIREDVANTFTAGNGVITHGVLPNNDPVLVTNIAITIGSTSATLASTAGLVNGDTYYVFATGLPYGTTITYAGSSSVTLSQAATLTNASASASLFSPASITAPGQINWSDPFYLKVVGTNLSYEFAANPTSADILLADNEVGYVTLIRDVAITPKLFYTYNSGPNTTTVTSIGNVSWTSSLLANDFLRAASDGDNSYTQIQSVDSSTQVTLVGNYVPIGQTSAGVSSVYSFGSYQASPTPSTQRDIYIASRSQVPSGPNVWWLFSRQDLGGSSPSVYVRFIGQELAYGDSNQIDSGIPKELLQYIGSPTESAAKPQYASALNPGSIQQVVSITTGDATTVASNQYFVIYPSNALREYYVWINKDGTGVDPKPLANGTPIEWIISTGQLASDTAASLATALNSTFFNDFSASASGSTVTVTNNSAGDSSAPSNFDVGTPFAISITTTGTGQGNFVVQDGDNLTLAIKKLDDQIASMISASIAPGYDETVDVVSSGAVPPSTLNGPVIAGTNIQLPPNSRNSNIQVYYEVGAGKLSVYLNGQKIVVGVDYVEVGTSGSASEYIAMNYNLVVGDQLEFTFGGGAGGGGGGEQGPPGPAGPQGSPGINAINATTISTKTSNYSVSLSDNVLLANCTTNAVTFTLPAASSATAKVYIFKKIDNSSNAMTILPSGGATIDGAASLSTIVQYNSFSMVCDGVGWWIW